MVCPSLSPRLCVAARNIFADEPVCSCRMFRRMFLLLLFFSPCYLSLSLRESLVSPMFLRMFLSHIPHSGFHSSLSLPVPCLCSIRLHVLSPLVPLESTSSLIRVSVPLL